MHARIRFRQLQAAGVHLLPQLAGVGLLEDPAWQREPLSVAYRGPTFATCLSRAIVRWLLSV
jgi:hypothetical protein